MTYPTLLLMTQGEGEVAEVQEEEGEEEGREEGEERRRGEREGIPQRQPVAATGRGPQGWLVSLGNRIGERRYGV